MAVPQGTVPVLILREGTRREKGRGAQENNIAAACAIADAVRTSLGPRGMDKMLVDSMGDVTVTNDGFKILKDLDVDHPAAKMMVEVAKTQDQECGDGTTSAVVLAGELLAKAEDLIDQQVHPTVIVNGYRQAAAKAKEILEWRTEEEGRAVAAGDEDGLPAVGDARAEEFVALLEVDGDNARRTRCRESGEPGFLHRSLARGRCAVQENLPDTGPRRLGTIDTDHRAAKRGGIRH